MLSTTLQVSSHILHCCYCCIPTPMTLANGGSPMFPLVVNQPASPSIWRGSVHKSRGDMWCVCGCSWRDDVCHVCECYRGDIVVIDVIWRRLCVNMTWGTVLYLFWVWARVRRVRRGSVSSELLMIGRGILQSRSHDCLIGRQECVLLFTPSCFCECFYHL